MLSKQKISQLKKLHSKKGREQSGQFLLEGWKSVQSAAEAGVEIDMLIYDEQKIEDPRLIKKLERSVKELFVASARELSSISETVTSQGIVAVLPKRSSADLLPSVLRRPKALIVAVDSINDPGNLGTIIRTCDWFGADALLIGSNSVDLYNPKVVRATMGSIFHLPIIEDADLNVLIEQCRTARCSVFAAGLDGSEDVRNVGFDPKSVVIIGSESHGISPEVSALADTKIMIPRFGKAESLNAAMACGIILSRFRL